MLSPGGYARRDSDFSRRELVGMAAASSRQPNDKRIRSCVRFLVRSAALIFLEVGTSGEDLPLSNFLLPGRKLATKPGQCDATENQMQGRFRRIRGGYNCLDRFLGVARLLSGLRFQILASLACRCRIIN